MRNVSKQLEGAKVMEAGKQGSHPPVLGSHEEGWKGVLSLCEQDGPL